MPAIIDGEIMSYLEYCSNPLTFNNLARRPFWLLKPALEVLHPYFMIDTDIRIVRNVSFDAFSSKAHSFIASFEIRSIGTSLESASRCVLMCVSATKTVDGRGILGAKISRSCFAA